MEIGKAPLPPPTLCVTGIIEKGDNNLNKSSIVEVSTIKTINYDLSDHS